MHRIGEFSNRKQAKKEFGHWRGEVLLLSEGAFLKWW